MDRTSIPSGADTGQGRLDLNLIRLYVAVYEAGSVSRAADRLGLTQPSVSYGLGRLRRAFGDQLFARGGRGMAPTPLAEQLYEQFRDALATVESAVESTRSFDASTSRRVFRVAMSDVGAICLVPPLLVHLQALAPEATLEIAQVPVDGILDELAAGKLDMAVGNLPLRHAAARSELLFPERYVCLLSTAHPRIGAEMGRKQFAAERHIVVVSPYSLHQHIDESLVERGIRRRVALKVPHFGILPAVIPGNDYLVMLPSRLGTVFERFAGVRSVELPVALPSFEVRVLWHARQQSNPANVWLRKTIVEALGSL
jgi:DNA-binding transcriptional LysR family regulator